MIERVSDTDCRVCSTLITDAMIGACASVGIEHGRTTRQELTRYLAARHQREQHEHRDEVLHLWDQGVSRLIHRVLPDTEPYAGTVGYVSEPHIDADCPFAAGPDIPMVTRTFTDQERAPMTVVNPR